MRGLTNLLLEETDAEYLAPCMQAAFKAYDKGACKANAHCAASSASYAASCHACEASPAIVRRRPSCDVHIAAATHLACTPLLPCLQSATCRQYETVCACNWPHADNSGGLDAKEFEEFARGILRNGPAMFFARVGKQAMVTSAILPAAAMVSQLRLGTKHI